MAKYSRLRLLAVLQIVLGGFLCFVAVALLILGQAATSRIKADQAIVAYIQSIADTKGLVTNTITSINKIMSQTAATCDEFASSADSLADGIEWWNKWLGKERFQLLTDSTKGFRDAAKTLRTTQTEINTRSPDLVTWEASFRTSCDSTIHTLNDLRESNQTLIQMIWLLGISGCCVAAVVLLSGITLYGIASSTLEPTKAGDCK